MVFDFSPLKSQQAIMKKIGRPKSETSAITLRLPDEMIQELDLVRRNEDDIPTRPEMIRRILADWLDNNKPET
jgi:metal-responsive CopG/Arc/MetJ family transcriptional regulator